VGRLWTSLADYFIRRGMFERARDVYEEGLTSVVTVRDFSLVYDALTQFEESLISAKMEQAADEDEEAPALEDEDGEDFLLKDGGDDLDLRLARLEHLMERRPELLSSVMLRQNPHNVHEWHKRAKLFAANPTKQILCYTEAVKTVDPERAVGKPHTLWVAFAKLYERHGDLPNARIIFEKAVQARFKYVDDLASVWCEWAEMELRHKNFKRALELMRRATARPTRPRTREEEKDLPVQDRVYRSLKLWSFYVDLEESLGTLDSAKGVYESILDLKVATPQIVLNYAAFMLEHKFFEEAFRVYERGIALFKYPHVKDIWTTYLTQFVARYGGKKVERARDLFRQAIDEAPAAACKPLFLAYAKYEEEHGLARNAMQIYDSAVKKVPEKERLAVYDIYVARASEFFGIGKVGWQRSAHLVPAVCACLLRCCACHHWSGHCELGPHVCGCSCLCCFADLHFLPSLPSPLPPGARGVRGRDRGAAALCPQRRRHPHGVPALRRAGAPPRRGGPRARHLRARRLAGGPARGQGLLGRVERV
jgi:pre-mRNA-splicing factor SYF1